ADGGAGPGVGGRVPGAHGGGGRTRRRGAWRRPPGRAGGRSTWPCGGGRGAGRGGPSRRPAPATTAARRAGWGGAGRGAPGGAGRAGGGGLGSLPRGGAGGGPGAGSGCEVPPPGPRHGARRCAAPWVVYGRGVEGVVTKPGRPAPGGARGGRREGRAMGGLG